MSFACGTLKIIVNRFLRMRSQIWETTTITHLMPKQFFPFSPSTPLWDFTLLFNQTTPWKYDSAKQNIIISYNFQDNTSNSLCRNVYSISMCGEGKGERNHNIHIYNIILLNSTTTIKVVCINPSHKKCEPPSKLPISNLFFFNPSFSYSRHQHSYIETISVCIWVLCWWCAAMYILMRLSRPFIHQPFTPSAIRPILSFLVIPQQPKH